MDVTINKLIMLSYAAFAVIVCTLGYLFYRSQLQALHLPNVDTANLMAQSRSTPAPGAEAISRRLQFEVERQRRRIDELQTLLEKREGVLKLQASRLKDNDQQYEDLQQEADDYLDMLFDVIQTSSLRVDNLARLDDSTSRNSGDPEETNESMETLRVALEVSQWELEESLATAEANVATANEAQTRLAVLQQAIAELGDVSIPLFIGLLADQDAEVRLWSAQSLGQLGASAVSAIAALRAAQEDMDPRVRDAASTSIQEITASW